MGRDDHQEEDRARRRSSSPDHVAAARQRLELARSEGRKAGLEEYRQVLQACAENVDPDQALDVLGEMEAEGVTPDRQAHAFVLLAHHLRGRAEAAEAYLREIPSHVLTTGHVHIVMTAYALTQHSQEVERLYREFDGSPTPPDADCRRTVLTALAMDRRWTDARRWYDEFVPEGERPPPRLLARLVDAHGRREAHGKLVSLYRETDQQLRREAAVSAAFVHAFARAGDPGRAERLLPVAVEATRDRDEREALVLACLSALGKRDSAAVERILAFAEEARIDLDHSATDPRRDLR